MMLTIDRVRGANAKRDLGAAYAGLAFAVATADDRSADLEGQAIQAFAKIDRTLEELGSSRQHLLSVTVYLSDHGQKAVFDTAWNRWIGDDCSEWPQRCCIGVTLAPGTLVEIVAIAAR